ncbi:MAG: hypothetical protein B6I20_14545 [Bacteroidetes bacterium 4572_117]|nr:MAG: hypothetical protein B6I20_14545 [Bacteroidetes bacterium 4572_117]
MNTIIKITFYILLIIFSNNLFGQNNLYNFSAKFEYSKSSETNWGVKKIFWNELNNTSYYNLITYSSNLRTEIGVNLFLLNNPQYHREANINYNKIIVLPHIRQKYKSLFASIGYNYSVASIKFKDYPGGWLFLLPPSKIYEQSFFIDAGMQLKLTGNQYLELLLGYEKLKYTHVVEKIPEPIIDYTQQNYFLKIQTLTSNIKFSEVKLLNMNEMQQKPWLLSTQNHILFKKDTISNNVLFYMKSHFYLGKFITDKIIFGAKISNEYEKYDETFTERYFLITPELKYLFFKSFFAGISYELGFLKTSEKYLQQSFSASIGNYLKLTNKSILETNIFYSYDTLFVGKYQAKYGNQINMRIGLVFQLLILL